MKSDALDRNYNVGTGVRTSLKELAEKLLKITGSNKSIEYVPRSQATLVKNRIGDPKLAAQHLGYKFQIDLDEGLKKLIDWRTNHIEEVKARRKAVGIED